MDLQEAVASSSGVNPSQVKVDSADAEDQHKAHLAKQVVDFQHNVPQLVREFQDMVLDMKLIQT